MDRKRMESVCARSWGLYAQAVNSLLSIHSVGL